VSALQKKMHDNKIKQSGQLDGQEFHPNSAQEEQPELQ